MFFDVGLRAARVCRVEEKSLAQKRGYGRTCRAGGVNGRVEKKSPLFTKHVADAHAPAWRSSLRQKWPPLRCLCADGAALSGSSPSLVKKLRRAVYGADADSARAHGVDGRLPLLRCKRPLAPSLSCSCSSRASWHVAGARAASSGLPVDDRGDAIAVRARALGGSAATYCLIFPFPHTSLARQRPR